MIRRVDCTRHKSCALCKNWLDPTNETLTKTTIDNIWQYDNSTTKKCLINGYETNADEYCVMFVGKKLTRN